MTSVVYFDVSEEKSFPSGDKTITKLEPLGRIEMGLYGNVVPKTALNFKGTCRPCLALPSLALPYSTVTSPAPPYPTIISILALFLAVTPTLVLTLPVPFPSPAAELCEGCESMVTPEKQIGYEGSAFHRVIPDFMLQVRLRARVVRVGRTCGAYSGAYAWARTVCTVWGVRWVLATLRTRILTLEHAPGW